MKRILFYISLPLLMMGCDTEKRIKPIGPTFGYVLAKMNGEPWIRMNKYGFQTTRGVIETSTTVNCPDGYYVIATEFYNGKGSSTENLHFKKIPIAIGTYKVIPNTYGYCDQNDPVYSNFFTVFGGDVSGDQYKILSSEDNYLQVDSYNSKSKEIKGSFQLTFVLERAGPDHILPDTLRFTDGGFLTKILN